MPSPRAATVLTIGGRQSPGLAPLAEREHVVQLPRGRVGAVPVGLVHHEYVADLQDPGLGRLDPVAHARGEQHHRGVRRRGDLDLGLPDAHRLDQDHLAARRVEHPERLRGGRGQAAEVAARGHRADVDAPGRSRAPASAPGRRAARRRRTARTGRPRAPRPACRVPGTP